MTEANSVPEPTSLETRIQLLEEAHVAHRQTLRELQGHVSRLYEELGIERGATRVMAPGGPRTVIKRIDALERGGLSWTTQEAIRARDQMSRLALAMEEIFDERERE